MAKKSFSGGLSRCLEIPIKRAAEPKEPKAAKKEITKTSNWNKEKRNESHVYSQ
jgi:hypothetical protein